ncbi:MAG: hypothetical protein Q8Q20_04690 [bacterium]|nr:hypothetical protein [bacterium]
MTTQDLETIVTYIVDQGLKAIHANTDERDLLLDYMGIFTKNNEEYLQMVSVVKTLGVPADKVATTSGVTYILNEPIVTVAGSLKALKVRKYDPSRLQRGAPDFQVEDFQAFKEKYLSQGHNFTLMVRKEFEALELKGEDVLVYFPNILFEERQR